MANWNCETRNHFTQGRTEDTLRITDRVSPARPGTPVAVYMHTGLEESVGAVQLAVLAYCEAIGYKVAIQIGVMGDRDRPLEGEESVLEEMIAYAESIPRPFDLVLVYERDATCRGTKDWVMYEDRLQAVGIDVQFVTDRINNDPRTKGIMESWRAGRKDAMKRWPPKRRP